jgi:hypothetical protein
MTSVPGARELYDVGALERVRATVSRSMISLFMRLLAGGLLAGVAAGVVLALVLRPSHERDVLFSASFGRHGLVTNEFAYWNPDDPRAQRSPDWEVTSGSLFARDDTGWTGAPNRGAPDADSRRATDSAVFRLRSAATDFGNVAVAFQLKLNALVTTPQTPAQNYDGVHVWLHYQTPQTLYYASVSRRDGQVVLGKKVAGRYVRLTPPRERRLALDRWHQIQAIIVDHARTVTLRLLIDGKLVVRAVDHGVGGPPIPAPGRVGLRGDNADFQFRSFVVRHVS